ncbi:ATP-binding protein [Deltaproteobacteria bacterium TL4]
MKRTVIKLDYYREQSSTIDVVIELLSKWDAQKPPEQLNRDLNRIKGLLPSLFQELSGKDMELKVKVFNLLGRAQIPNAASFLLAYLSDADVEIRESVIRALGFLKDPIAILPLKNAYDNESEELQKLIIEALNQLVDDLFFFKLLGNDPNLNKITIALELLDLLVSEREHLLSPSGFRRFLDQLFPYFQQLKRSAFDARTLKQSIETLHDELHRSLEKSECSIETMKFQLKIQHTQLQSFLERSDKKQINADDSEPPSPREVTQDLQEVESEIEKQSAQLSTISKALPEVHPLMNALTQSVERISARLEEVTQKLERLPSFAEAPTTTTAEEAFEPATAAPLEWDEEPDPEVTEALEEEPQFDPESLSLALTETEEELIHELFQNSKKRKDPSETPQFKGSVFVLDDSPLMLKTIQSLMQYAGFSEVIPFAHPILAVDAYKKDYQKLVLISTDWNMPEMDGRAFMIAIRAFEKQENLPPCPIIFITDETNIYKVRLLLAEGAAKVISKPFIPDDLIKVVKEVTGVETKEHRAETGEFLNLQQLIVEANRSAADENASKKIKKKLFYHKSLKVHASIKEDLTQCLRYLIAMADFLSLPGQTVTIEFKKHSEDETSATVSLNGKTAQRSETEIHQSAEKPKAESQNLGGFLSELKNLIGSDSAEKFTLNHLMRKNLDAPSEKKAREESLKGWSLDSFMETHPHYQKLHQSVAKVYGSLDWVVDEGMFSLKLTFSWPLEEDQSLAAPEPIPWAEADNEHKDEVEAFQYLMDLEEDGDVKTTIAALEKLCIREPVQIFHVVDYLHDGHFERAEQEILEMFHKLNRIDVIPYLIRRFAHLHKEFKLWTLSFIAEHDIKYGFFFIISVLRDQDKDVRHRAMAVLVEHFDMRFLPLMEHSLKHTFNMPKAMEGRELLGRLPARERSAVLSILLLSNDFEKSLPLLLGYLNDADRYEQEQIYKALGHQTALKYLKAGQVESLIAHFEKNEVLESFPHLTLRLIKSTNAEFLTWLLGKIDFHSWKRIFKARFIDDLKTAWEAVSDFLAEGMEEVTTHLQHAGEICHRLEVGQEDAEELYRLLHMSKGVALSLDLEIMGSLYHHLETLLSKIMPIQTPGDWSKNEIFIEKIASVLEVNEIANGILLRAFKNDTFLKKTIYVHHLFPRLEQLANKLETMLQKELDIQFLEEATLQVDSALFQIINNCLIQLIKNSIDHGLEMPEARIQQNKPAKGVIQIRISTQDQQAKFSIQDDGAGLNTDKILSKAVERKIISAPESKALQKDPSRKHEIYKLIFSPQMSTASRASMVSGRGVGMNIVKTEIEKVGGTLQCESERGKGSTFTIILPFQMPEHVIIDSSY